MAVIGVPAAQSGPAPVIGAGVHEGSKSGLPVPRFVSLKSSRVNVRVGPGEDYKIAWVFTRSALPVEVIQEYDTWRRIRDSDGTVGWVFQSLLSGKRTAVVAPWASGDPRPVHASASEDSTVTAYLQPGVMGQIDRCSRGWCRISSTQYSGWIPQDQLWGTYQGEEVN
jgi:SH3-like domain-containing protein